MKAHSSIFTWLQNLFHLPHKIINTNQSKIKSSKRFTNTEQRKYVRPLPQASQKLEDSGEQQCEPKSSFTKCTKREGKNWVGGHGCSLRCVLWSSHDKKRSPQNTRTWFSACISRFPTCCFPTFIPFLATAEEGGGGESPPTILAYWVGNLTSKTEMFPYHARKIKTDFTVKCLTLTENLVCGLWKLRRHLLSPFLFWKGSWTRDSCVICIWMWCLQRIMIFPNF